jgi:hypothetical protein
MILEVLVHGHLATSLWSFGEESVMVVGGT